MEWNEVGPGIVVVNNIGSGMKYIDRVEYLVEHGALNWVPHNQKSIKQDENRKAMNTMYIQNIERRGLSDYRNPTETELLHQQLFSGFERDFRDAYAKYIEDFGVPYTQKEDYEILKYSEGNFFIDHVDDGLFMSRRVSMVYYFNGDYEGGEIVFPRFDITIKPKEAQLLLFPSNYMYNHNVNPIISGTRYSMVNWLK